MASITAYTQARSALIEQKQIVNAVIIGTGELIMIRADDTQFSAGNARGAQGPPGTDGLPVGSVITYAGTVPPEKFLPTYGQSLQRSEYPELFEVLGTYYGSDSGSTFKIPNIKGRVVVGVDIADPEFDTPGATMGTRRHQLSIAELPAHSHAAPRIDTTPAGFITSTRGFNVELAKRTASPYGGDGPWSLTIATNEKASVSENTAQTGEGIPHENMQPSIVLLYLIKTVP